MLKRTFNYFTMLATGLFFITLGGFFVFNSKSLWSLIYNIFTIGISIAVVMKLFNLILNFRKLENRLRQIGDILIWLIADIIAFVLPNMYFTVVTRLMGAWILLHAFVKIVVLYIRIKDHLIIQIHSVLFLIGDLIFAFFLIYSPNKHISFISVVLGAYFFIYGINTITDLYREVMPFDSGNRIDERIRLSLPPSLSVILPPHLLHTLLDKDNEDKIKEQFETIKEDIPIDMEILIHLAPSGPAMLGHTDLIYRGFVISYGCYDPHNRHLLGTMGDGVVIMAPRNSYIKNCLENENKILVSFGLSLNKGQKEKLNERLIEVFSEFVDFESDEQLKQAGKTYKGKCDDYISRVTRTSPTSRFYKIKAGKLKTFFVVSSNCVFFMSHILNVVGLHLFDLSGIVSPGAYYDFLNKQFKSNKGFIVSRKLYRKHDAYLFANKCDEEDNFLHT